MKKARTVARPFRTDYAGAWVGHCKSRENAVNAAIKHLTKDGYTRCTITDLETGKDVVRIVATGGCRVITINAVAPFRRVEE